MPGVSKCLTRAVGPSCIVVLDATAAASAIVFALYELFKVCVSEGGRLYIVGYPNDYIHSLSSLGLTDIHGFVLRESTESALREIGEAEQERQ